MARENEASRGTVRFFLPEIRPSASGSDRLIAGRYSSLDGTALHPPMALLLDVALLAPLPQIALEFPSTSRIDTNQVR